MRKLYRPRLWLTIGWLLIATVFTASLLPIPPAPIALPTHFDKWQHVTAYFVLSAWFAQIYPFGTKLLLYSGGFFVMGALLEVLQGLTAYRSADAYDLAANTLGLALGLASSFTILSRVLSRVDRYFSKPSKPDGAM